MNNLIWIEVYKQAIKHNVQTIRKHIGNKVLLAPSVKSNAYGHGLVKIARLVLDAGADWVCVNCIDEAEMLRQAGVDKPILVMGYIGKQDLVKTCALNIKLFLCDRETAHNLSRVADEQKTQIDVHIKVDTGMSRQGVLVGEAKQFIREVQRLPSLNIEGVATHFATSDKPESPEYFDKQLQAFKNLVDNLKKEHNNLIFHCANSAATLLYPESHFGLVRSSLSIYGYYPSAITQRLCEQYNIILKPSLTLKTKVAAVKSIPAGSYVSYECTYKTVRETKVAVLPIGYYDGLDRKLSNAGEVIIRGQRARILGLICMNITVVDVTDISGVTQDDEVVIIGQQGGEQASVEEVAEKAGMINYEIMTRLRESIPRYYI